MEVPHCTGTKCTIYCQMGSTPKIAQPYHLQMLMLHMGPSLPPADCVGSISTNESRLRTHFSQLISSFIFPCPHGKLSPRDLVALSCWVGLSKSIKQFWFIWTWEGKKEVLASIPPQSTGMCWGLWPIRPHSQQYLSFQQQWMCLGIEWGLRERGYY